MPFEYDEAKSRSNKDKHGIDFAEGQALWEDPARVETPARSETEPRRRVIGRMEGRYWTAFFTYRGQRIRIISVRRSRKEEIARYEKERNR